MTQALPALRSDLRYTPHVSREQVWYAVEDPNTGRFVRLGRHEYLAAIHANGQRDAREIVALAKLQDAEFRLGEQDITLLVRWLSSMGMLATGAAAPAPTKSFHSSRTIWDPLNARFPVLPGAFVERMTAPFQSMANGWSAMGAVLLALVAAAVALTNRDILLETTKKLFVAEGRAWWIVAWLLLKIVHEFGHALTAVRAGSRIRSAGISLIFFAPVPFIDVSDLWSISNRWQRMLCSAGGILAEVMVAAVAVLVAVWVDNESIRYLACAVATTGTATTLLFNANPFVRFDGYYILADLVQKPNLWSDGQKAATQRLWQVIQPLNRSLREHSLALALYGFACWFNRIVTLVGLSMWAIIVWQELGLLLIAWAAHAWFIAPWYQLHRTRNLQKRAAASSITFWDRHSFWLHPAAVLGGLWLLMGLPSPIQPAVPGVLGYHEPSIPRCECEGFLVKVHVRPLAYVEEGDLIAEFRNEDIPFALATKQLEIAESQAKISVMQARGELANMQAEQSKLAALNEQIVELEKNVHKLQIRANATGTVVEMDLDRQIGKFFKAGEPLMVIANPTELEAKLSAGQFEHSVLRNHEGKPLLLSCPGQSDFQGILEKVDWRGSDVLEEPSLAATYGGPITVELNQPDADRNGLKLPAPRFDLRVKLDDATCHVPGQLVWAHLPNQSSNLFELLRNWIEKQWYLAKQQNQSS